MTKLSKSTITIEPQINKYIRDDVYEIKVDADIQAFNELYIQSVIASLCIPRYMFDEPRESAHKMAVDELLKHD